MHPSSATRDSTKTLVSPSATMDEIHAAWLAAGARGDVNAMRQLRHRFPEWIDLQRQVRPAASDSTAIRQASICSWNGFHLQTLGASALHTAAWEGSVDIMQFLLESGQDPDTGDDSAMTPMMLSIMRLNLMTMRCVFINGEAVRRNLVVDCRDEEDERRDKMIAGIKLLLRFGADVDARSQDGKTALHCSTSDDAFQVAKVLLESGASLDAQDEIGRTPLHYAVQEDGLLVTDLLLSRGSNIDAEDDDGISPLSLMLEQGNMNVLQVFMNHHHLVATPTRHDFARALLFQAVDTQREDAVRFIVENEYASVTVTSVTGETLLHRAIVKRNSAMVELLVDLDPTGENLAAATVKGEAPIHYAARYGSPHEVEVLLHCLANIFGELQELDAENPVNAVNETGETALYIVGSVQLPDAVAHSSGFEADTGSLDVRSAKVHFLLQHGARLFPLGFLVDALAPKNPMPSESVSEIVLPIQVQHVLRHWLMESGRCDSEPEAEETAHQHFSDGTKMDGLTELCAQWLAGAACTGSWASFPSILICAGYARELVPLLVELPLRRRSIPTLLRQLEKFARRHCCHDLILQLYDELHEAWQRVPEART
ncbi:hypothetical protein PHYBOEH_007548 [Phytophthora boehmeriae]|uniref:Uncharacterized protein n=1 Tax=Phytophthora boehmeriae TaxID=109152 RepID=A0A8T1W770_9STRA|nr:hypothetical protein PHYBOEH_007548 [Phytophthora boehmeriae]